MSSFELSDRPRRVLATLVREYIETGDPVPSQMLARKSGLGVSSATVRNVLAQLEVLGYVHQPHTSAGRVPTDRGYRVFVDLLLESRRPSRPPFNVEDEIRAHAGRLPLMEDLLINVSHMVSRAARYVGFALAEEDGDELVHAGVCEQQVRRIGHQGGRRHDCVLLRLEEVEERLADLRGRHHGGSEMNSEGGKARSRMDCFAVNIRLRVFESSLFHSKIRQRG